MERGKDITCSAVQSEVVCLKCYHKLKTVSNDNLIKRADR